MINRSFLTLFVSFVLVLGFSTQGHAETFYGIFGEEIDPPVFVDEVVDAQSSDVMAADDAPRMYWHHRTSGRNADVTTSNNQYSGARWQVTVANTNWRAVGLGDFNGDGKDDVVWWNYSFGTVAVVYPNDDGTLQYDTIGRLPSTSWYVVGVADFDNDGGPDLLLQHGSTRRVAFWMLDGVEYRETIEVDRDVTGYWWIAGVGDFNKDGNTDILWRDWYNGTNGIWYMSGTEFQSVEYIESSLSAKWTVQGVGDVNVDGNVDIIWRDCLSSCQSTGEVRVWLMNSQSRSSSFNLPLVSDRNWTLVGVGNF